MKNINSRALSLATSWTTILIVVMTIWAELYKPFKTMLADLSGHHWISKSLIALIFFILLYSVLPKKTISKEASEKYEIAVVWVVVLSGIVIFSFYVWHYLTA